MKTSTRRRSLGPALLLAAGLGLAGCSSGGGDEAMDSEPAASEAREEAPGAAFDADGGEDGVAREATGNLDESALVDRAAEAPEPGGPAQPAVIQTGTMTVQSDDVATARFDLDKVVDAHDGSIADEKTTATSEGEVRLSRVVLRVPSQDFDAAMTDLAELGEVTASTRKAEDVTGEVIDTRARIRAQEQSLARVEVLFSRAEDIRDIVVIEAQLSRRQAELDSLKGQLAWLEDQTTYSTITVYLEPTPAQAAAAPQDDDIAFVGGLKSGWHALSALGAGLATVGGALLPFAVVGVLLGVPVVVLVRRWFARHPLRRPAPAPEG
ncbi:DUF4349 domain-containing protein [Nocardioides sp. GXQ0305]|uniref:DUF4349 domain-containing protein n=1 Tax=Nocardioides sp. GXQ0305 TaxID=3423912 RepID=UPI003D7D1749